MGFLIMLFVIIVGGCWLIGKLIGAILFPKSNDLYSIDVYKEFKPTLAERIISSYVNKNPTIPPPTTPTKPDTKNVFDKNDSFKRSPIKLDVDELISKITKVIYVDDFTAYTKIYFTDIGDNGSEYIRMQFDGAMPNENIGFTFEIAQENLILFKIGTNVKEMGLAKGDELIIIFDDSSKMILKFDLPGVINVTNSFAISLIQLKEFAIKKIDRWRLLSSRRNIFIVSDNTNNGPFIPYKSKQDIQKIFQYLAWRTGSEYFKLKGFQNQNYYSDIDYSHFEEDFSNINNNRLN